MTRRKFTMPKPHLTLATKIAINQMCRITFDLTIHTTLCDFKINTQQNFDLSVKSIHMYKNNSRETFSERKFLRAILRTYFPETLKKMLNIGRNWITLLSWFSDIYLDFYFHDKNVVIWIDNPTEFREIMIKGYRPQRFELFACGLSGYSEICVASFTCQVNTRKWEGKL